MEEVDTLLKTYRNWKDFTVDWTIFKLLLLVCCICKVPRFINFIYFPTEPNRSLFSWKSPVLIIVQRIIESIVDGDWTLGFLILLPSIIW